MPHVVQTETLVAEGVLSAEQAKIIADRSRETMLSLLVNIVLTAGIIAASLGFVFWIADAVGVALLGLAFLAVGMTVLLKGDVLYRLLGHAGTLIGAGMLIAGAGFELVDKYPDAAGAVMTILGAIATLAAAFAFVKGPATARFSTGAVVLMGLAMHITGSGILVQDFLGSGLPKVTFFLYTAFLIAGAGVALNVRVVTALAIVPFAQVLDTGTAYFHAAYVFYSPEPTLTILQMALLIGACVWVGMQQPERINRHTGILAIMAAVVGNLSFLVASIFGDDIGLSFFRDSAPSYNDFDGDWEAYNEAYEAWRATFFHISEHVYSVVWAAILVVGAWFAASRHLRGLFNASVTFLGIHAYTQAFETFADEPMVYALGGLAAIPLAWGLWRLNRGMFGEFAT